jgi:hypothetical protein
MSKQTTLRIASIVLIIFGLFELLGLLMLLAPKEYLPANFESQSLFWAIVSGLYGISRIIAGAAIWSNKKWGMVFGIILCVVTMVVAPTIIPFGVIDLIFTIIITICLLFAKYGNDKAVEN